MVIPVIVFRESIQPGQLVARLQLKERNESLAWRSSGIVAASLFIVVLVVGKYAFESPDCFTQGKSQLIFTIFFLLYMLCSFLVSGLLTGTLPFNQWFYPVNLLIIWFLLSKSKEPFNIFVRFDRLSHARIPIMYFSILIFLILLMAWFSVLLHDGLPGAHDRFSFS